MRMTFAGLIGITTFLTALGSTVPAMSQDDATAAQAAADAATSALGSALSGRDEADGAAEASRRETSESTTLDEMRAQVVDAITAEEHQ